MGHLWFIIQIVCTHYPLKDCWHFTMQYLQDLLVLEMFKYPDIGEFMIYKVVYVFLYESHWKVHTMAVVPHVDDCSALWIGNPAPLIDIDVHLHCEAFYKIELDASILTFSGHILWFLIITLLMNKCMLFHPHDDRMGMDTAFFGLVQPTVKSNEFCLYHLQLLALGIRSIQEINSVPFCPAILAMHITPCHLYFDSSQVTIFYCASTYTHTGICFKWLYSPTESIEQSNSCPDKFRESTELCILFSFCLRKDQHLMPTRKHPH